MRYAFAVVVLLAALLATACAGSELVPQATPRRSPATRGIDHAALPPEPVGRVPEGVLLVQKESQSPTTFGIRADGSILDYGKGFYYVQSPDGRHAAFLRGERVADPNEIAIMTADGEETFSRQAPDADPGWMTWSPDGSELAYVMWDEVGSKGDLYRVNADGSGHRQVTGESGPYFIAGWTNDGQILVAGDSEVVLMGAKCRAFPFPEGILDRGQLKISPDSRYVAAVVGDWERGFEVWLLEIGSGEWRQVADMGLVARPERERYVSAGVPLGVELEKTDNLLLKGPPPVIWSADSRRIAYVRSGDDGEGVFASELRMVDIESGQDVGLAQDAWLAEWSPDGRYLATLAEGEVVVFGGDGSGGGKTGVRADQLLWTGGGLLLAAYAGGVSLIDPATGETQAVVTAEGDNIRAAQVWREASAWSAEGRYLAFTTSEDYGQGNGSLYVLDAETGRITLIVDGGGFYPVAWLRG